MNSYIIFWIKINLLKCQNDLYSNIYLVKETLNMTFYKIIIVQIKGETGTIAEESIVAAKSGANVVMVDTGNFEHLRIASHALTKIGLRSEVQIAFAGNIRLHDLDSLSQFDLDIVDIGYSILDAPCLPMRFDVIKTF